MHFLERLSKKDLLRLIAAAFLVGGFFVRMEYQFRELHAELDDVKAAVSSQAEENVVRDDKIWRTQICCIGVRGDVRELTR